VTPLAEFSQLFYADWVLPCCLLHHNDVQVQLGAGTVLGWVWRDAWQLERRKWQAHALD
jgi:hypothetical protein